MKQEKKELLTGMLLVVLLLGIAFVIQKRANIHHHDNTFVLYADFARADGLLIGAPVRIAGLPVGKLVDQSMTPLYTSRLKLAFHQPVALPTDSAIAIETDGLLGGKYLEISPGGDSEMMTSEGEFLYTQDALILDELLEKLNTYISHKNKEGTHEEESH